MAGAPRRALVVYESMFDNTAEVADAVVRGLKRSGFLAHAVPVSSLAAGVPVHVDLLVAGGPTHALSLSRPTTRAEAVRSGAPPARARIGLREWLGTAHPDRLGTDRVAVFDTRGRRLRRLPLSAATSATRKLRRRGFRLICDPEGFLVRNEHGPLLRGEAARAERWAQDVAAACAGDSGGAPPRPGSVVPLLLT